MGKRIYEQVDVTAGAGATVYELLYTSTAEEPRKLKRISVNINTALCDLLVVDEREDIGDIPLDAKPLTDKWVDFDRDIQVGHQLQIGLRNGTGGGVTMVALIESEVGK